MPRRRADRQPVAEPESESESEEESIGSSLSITIKKNIHPLLAKQWGADQWFDMCKTTNNKQECPICLESCLDCKLCLALLVPCMHVVHYRCLFSMARPECPICRPSNTS